MLGIVYWFWTQVQYLQRKVNLLDNVVYEMKSFISNLPGTNAKPPNTVEPDAPEERESFQPPVPNLVPTAYNPPPESVAGDLEAERLASEVEFEPFSGENKNPVETVYSEPPEDINNGVEELNDDLQPGGLASGAQSNSKKIEVFTDNAIESPLSSLSIKELRRMAEANNIPGAMELKKKDLIKLLRDKVGQIIGKEQEQEKEQEHILSFDDIGAPNSE